MKTNTNSRKSLAYIGLPIALAMFMAANTASAYVPLTGSVSFGSRNANVTNLQEFLASMPDIYPEGTISGYFGALTQRAVQRFQATYGIVSSGSPSTTGYGRVGPATMAKINSMIAGGSSALDQVAPWISMTMAPQVTGTTATFAWNTNESATGRVYYSTSPLQMTEGDVSSNGFAVTSGQVGSFDSIARMGQTSTLTGLMPNTTYYYTIVATDLAGNVSVVGPNNTFRTNAQ